MEYNTVSFMHHGTFYSRFLSLNPRLLDWLERHGYKHFKLDNYDDMIMARSSAEAEMIHRYQIANP